MKDYNFKVDQINTLIHFISGYVQKDDEGIIIAKCLGLKREIGLTEGTRRILNKILKELESEMKLIKEALAEAGEDQARIKEINEMDYNINLSEELLFSKVEDLKPSFDYTIVYELLCSDY